MTYDQMLSTVAIIIALGVPIGLSWWSLGTRLTKLEGKVEAAKTEGASDIKIAMLEHVAQYSHEPNSSVRVGAGGQS